MSAGDPHDYDDYEYRLEEPAPSALCGHCGGRLSYDGSCPKCGNLMEKLEESHPDVGRDVDEYGMPIERKSKGKGWSNMLELEELGEGELPATFYAVSLAVVTLGALLAIVTNAPVATLLWLGVALIVIGSGVLAFAYKGMLLEVGPWSEVASMPWRALALTVSAGDPPPKHLSITIGKYALLAILLGGLSLIVSLLLRMVL
ncbi:MAG: hypothetical protein KDB14_03420 [Planctomycetales bacterium]|nr:hypothetical protein [Planctomycetales bacterium]